MDKKEIEQFIEALGHTEEPFGMYYTDEQPQDGISPKKAPLPSIEAEAAKEIDWGLLDASWSCVLGTIWRARKKNTIAYFDKDHFGCLGGAFYLGFLKPQLESIVYYVSTGIPGEMEGEHYLESPEVTRNFFQTIDPITAPARYCVFKPLSLFDKGERPQLVSFFGRAEVISGLHQLATFVTNDFEVVQSPFGAGCSALVTWPLRFLAQGKLKAVVGGWDPSERKYLKPDELTFTVPLEMFHRMVTRWRESFLKTNTWASMKKRIERSHKVWGDD